MKILAIIEAFEKGEDMKSYVNNQSKFTFKILDEEIIKYVIRAIKPISDDSIAILSYKKDELKSIIGNSLNCHVIDKLKFNGDIISNLSSRINDFDKVLLINGAMATLTSDSLKAILSNQIDNNLDVLYTKGLYLFNVSFLNKYLSSFNGSKIDDVLKNLMDGNSIRQIDFIDKDELLMINNRVDYAKAIKIIQLRINKSYMLNGVSIIDPNTTYISYNAHIGNDSIIYPNTYIYGKSIIGISCELGPNAYIIDSFIDNGAVLKNCSIDSKTLKNEQ